jgi:hypothetical protein
LLFQASPRQKKKKKKKQPGEKFEEVGNSRNTSCLLNQKAAVWSYFCKQKLRSALKCNAINCSFLLSCNWSNILISTSCDY